MKLKFQIVSICLLGLGQIFVFPDAHSDAAFASGTILIPPPKKPKQKSDKDKENEVEEKKIDCKKTPDSPHCNSEE